MILNKNFDKEQYKTCTALFTLGYDADQDKNFESNAFYFASL